MASDIEYREIKTFSPAALAEIRRLYLIAGWCSEADDVSFLPPLFAGSELVFSAWSGDHVAGIGRAISDGVSDAYLQDIVVAPEFRRRGIGTALVTGLTDRLRRRGIGWIGLVGAPGTEAFYASLGFRAPENHTFWLFPGVP